MIGISAGAGPVIAGSRPSRTGWKWTAFSPLRLGSDIDGHLSHGISGWMTACRFDVWIPKTWKVYPKNVKTFQVSFRNKHPIVFLCTCQRTFSIIHSKNRKYQLLHFATERTHFGSPPFFHILSSHSFQ